MHGNKKVRGLEDRRMWSECLKKWNLRFSNGEQFLVSAYSGVG